MSTKKLLILTGVFAALLAFVVFFERHQPTSEEAAKAKKRLVDFKKDDVSALTVERPDLPKLELKKGAGGRWMLAGEPADAVTVDALVGDLGRLDVVGEIRTEFDAKEFGLDVPKAKVTLAFPDGSSKTVVFGKDVPGTDATAASEGNRFGAVRFAPLANLTKPVDEYRSKNLIEVPTTDVTGVTIVKGPNRIVLARQEKATPAADGVPAEWRIEEPVKDLANRTFVDQLLGDLSAARISEFPTVPPSDLPRVGLQPPVATLLATKGAEAVAKVAFGAAKADAAGKIYARRDATVVVVDDRLSEDLGKELTAFREPKILPFDSWLASRVSFESGGVRTGAEKLEGESETTWRSGGKNVAASLVGDLNDRLARIEAKTFVSRKDFKSYGIPPTDGKGAATPIAAAEVTIGKETKPRTVRFFAVSRPAGSVGPAVVAAEVAGRADAMLVEATAVDELRSFAEKIRTAATGTPTPAPKPVKATPAAPAPPATSSPAR